MSIPYEEQFKKRGFRRDGVKRFTRTLEGAILEFVAEFFSETRKSERIKLFASVDLIRRFLCIS